MKIRNSLKVAGLAEDFLLQTIYSATMVQNGKPAPNLLLAAEKMESTSSQCLAIEDSIPSIQAGKTASMYAVGFPGESHIMDADRQASLKRADADKVFPNMIDVRTHLTAINILN